MAPFYPEFPCLLSIEKVKNESDFFEKKEADVSNIPIDFTDSLEISYNEITDKPIKMFDIDSCGNILICFKNGSANVYSEDLTYQYSVSYCSNQSSSIFFDSEQMVILLDKSDILVYLNEEREIDKCYRFENTFDNAERYEILQNQHTINYNDYTYVLNNNLLRSELIQIHDNQKSELVYSSNSTFLNMLEGLGIIAAFLVSLVIIVILIEWKSVFKFIKNLYLSRRNC